MKRHRASSAAFISTYPPRQCGIATFTKDLTKAFNRIPKNPFKTKIVAMNNSHSKYIPYPSEVKLKIRDNVLGDYSRAARKINRRKSIKIVNVQHEFGLYGGKYLNYLTAFYEYIHVPVVTTFHTVIPNPPESLKCTVKYIAKKSACIIVLTKTAVKILEKDYGIRKSKIKLIPHGIHNVPFEPSKIQKSKLGLEDKLIISSFGLVTGGKNYEAVIKALPKIVKKYPNLLYLILGRTHPGIYKQEGEKYRNKLKKLIKKLKLENNVKFVNKYLKQKELLQYLRASDVFVSSGLGLHQIVSGTLSYAVGCGRPVITIPFLHAKELITKDRGILVDIGDSKSYAKAVIKLLSNQKLRERMSKNAYKASRFMLWDNVVKSYMEVFKKYT
ncbi:MAG: glycosyltransferase [Candidatus Woesearchaeota archaeon]|nr:glycosyl transferase family 1 [Candidatus Woesearchaeota archaeon]MDP6647784.1 glycosyltransferase [Candidatus Woesearchaeota archaeon]|tara:strand:- start:977 stop:2134 length:1158 start_codon:yes stop_codon:yes gene_type:complete